MTTEATMVECECDEAIARVLATGEATTCAACGERLEPQRMPRPSAPPTTRNVSRVYDADRDGDRLSSVPAEPTRQRVEDDFTVRLRRLVVDLRAAELDGAGASAIQYRERVQCGGGGSYDGPRIGAATVRRPVSEKLERFAAVHPKEAATLRWLRAFGPAYDLLAGGKVGLVLHRCAEELGTLEQRVRWTREKAGAEVWARAALGRAMVAWWGEAAVAVVAREGATG